VGYDRPDEARPGELALRASLGREGTEAGSMPGCVLISGQRWTAELEDGIGRMTDDRCQLGIHSQR
jgi:hypothetical protein